MMLLTVHTYNKEYEFYMEDSEASEVLDLWDSVMAPTNLRINGIYKTMVIWTKTIKGISVEDLKPTTNVGPSCFNMYRKKTPFDREEEANEESRVSENKAQNQIPRNDE